MNVWDVVNPDSGLQAYLSTDELVIDACERAIREYEFTLLSTAGIYIGGRDKAAMRERIKQLKLHITVTETNAKADQQSTTQRLISDNMGDGWYSLFPYGRQRPSERVHYVSRFKDDHNDQWNRPWAMTACGAGMKIHSFYGTATPQGACRSCLRIINKKGTS